MKDVKQTKGGKMSINCLWEEKNRQFLCQLCAVECEDRLAKFEPEKAIEAQVPRKRDEIDDWLEKECNLHAGCCSSIEELKYCIGREVAENLWRNKQCDNNKSRSDMTTADIELILNIEAEVQKEYPLPYLEMKGKGEYLNEILNRFNEKKGEIKK